MVTNCTVDCNISGSTIEIDSEHSQIEVISTSELKFSRDTDNGETVVFTIPDFTHQGTDYTVAVTSTTAGGSTSTVWPRAGNGCVSPEYGADISLDIDIVATQSGSSGQITGGGNLQIRTKGKPDL